MQLTPREYLNQYQKQYASSRILNNLVAMLPPNGTGIYPLELIADKFTAYFESIPSPEYSPPAPSVPNPPSQGRQQAEGVKEHPLSSS